MVQMFGWFKAEAARASRRNRSIACVWRQLFWQELQDDMAGRSATVYWMTVPGRIKSQMFRGVPALQKWLELRLETIMQG